MEPIIAIPQLPAKDLDLTRQFYEKLGFHCLQQYPDPTAYLIMQYETIELHFWPFKDLQAETSISSCYLRFDTLDKMKTVFTHWEKVDLPLTNCPRLTPFEDRPWGMTEFYLVDINGNLIKCGIETNKT